MKGIAESGSTVKVYSGTNCNKSVLASGAEAAFSSTGLTATVSDNTSTDFRVTARYS